MSSPGYGRMRVVAEQRREPLVPSGVMGMLIFVAIEAMMFAGMISAFTIIKSSALVWPAVQRLILPHRRGAMSSSPKRVTSRRGPAAATPGS